MVFVDAEVDLRAESIDRKVPGGLFDFRVLQFLVFAIEFRGADHTSAWNLFGNSVFGIHKIVAEYLFESKSLTGIDN